MSQLTFPLLLLLIILKASRQNGGQTAGGKNADISRTDKTATNHEHFETYDGEQKKKRQTEHGQRKQREGGGRGTAKAKSRSRYLEFAETEFSRPSSYLPVPFVTPANNRLQEIPARTLSQLIRQHIARNRMKQLVEPENVTDNLRSAPSRVKEFRQTPFRRLPSNSTVLSYAEKRRQWKAELKRRLKEQKVRTRVIPPLLISGGGFSSILTDREPENRYYVTYSPQTRTYQVSRHPPPYLYTTDQDTLPQQMQKETPQQVQTEEQERHQQQQGGGEEETEEEEQAEEEPLEAKTAQSPTKGESAVSTKEEPHLTVDETYLTTAPTVEEWSTTTTVPTTTVRRPALLVILQNAEQMANGQSHREQSQQVEAVKTEQQKQPLKQILFLDDYEQVQGGDEEGNEMAENANESEKGGDREGQPQGEEEEDEFVAEENEEDEEMFFFKPSGGSSSSSSLSGDRRTEEAQNGREDRNDPFRILVHETSKRV